MRQRRLSRLKGLTPGLPEKLRRSFAFVKGKKGRRVFRDTIRSLLFEPADFEDLSSLGGIEANKVDLKAGDYHSHSVLSQRVGARESRSRSASPPSRAILWKASSHPPRGFLAGRTTKWLFSTSSSTVSARRHCSNSVLGMRIPRELPIRTTVVFMGISLS